MTVPPLTVRFFGPAEIPAPRSLDDLRARADALGRPELLRACRARGIMSGQLDFMHTPTLREIWLAIATAAAPELPAHTPEGPTRCAFADVAIGETFYFDAKGHPEPTLCRKTERTGWEMTSGWFTRSWYETTVKVWRTGRTEWPPRSVPPTATPERGT